LLIKVVDVAVENLDEQLDADGGVHACVGDAERALETFEDAFAVAVELSLVIHGQILSLAVHHSTAVSIIDRKGGG
jgi:hypothetical protein